MVQDRLCEQEGARGRQVDSFTRLLALLMPLSTLLWRSDVTVRLPC